MVVGVVVGSCFENMGFGVGCRLVGYCSLGFFVVWVSGEGFGCIYFFEEWVFVED